MIKYIFFYEKVRTESILRPVIELDIPNAAKMLTQFLIFNYNKIKG